MIEQHTAAIQRVRDDIASGGVWMPNLNDVLLLLDALDAATERVRDLEEELEMWKHPDCGYVSPRSRTTAAPQPAASPATTGAGEEA